MKFWENQLFWVVVGIVVVCGTAFVVDSHIV